MPESRESGAAPATELPASEQTVAERSAGEQAVAELGGAEASGDEPVLPRQDDGADASTEAAEVESRPVVADEVLLASAALAQRALLEVTPPETVGSVVGHVVEGEHVLTLLFAADLAGYPGWHWSVTIARVDDADATVLETELMPGERALVAPEWVPWSERLAEYRAAQAAAAAEAAERGAADEPDADEFDGEFDGEEFDDEDGLDAEHDDESDGDESDDESPDDEDEDLDEDDEHFDDHDEAYDGIEIDALDEAPGDDDAGHDDDTEGDDVDR